MSCTGPSFVSLHLSSHLTVSLLQPAVQLSSNITLLPRSVQPVCAVRAVGQLQARTGTSNGLEITASVPGAPSSMRKVGPGRRTGSGMVEWARLWTRVLLSGPPATEGRNSSSFPAFSCRSPPVYKIMSTEQNHSEKCKYRAWEST